MALVDRLWSTGLVPGLIAGVLWGWASMAVNSVSGVFPYEGTFLHNLLTFSVGGALLGILAGGVLGLAYDYLPFRGALAKAVLVSFSIWFIFFGGGVVLSIISTERYHLHLAAAIQGAALAVLLGCILGFLWRIKKTES